MNCVSTLLIVSGIVAALSVVAVLYGDQLLAYVPQLTSIFTTDGQQQQQQQQKPEFNAYLDTPHTRGKINPITGDYETFGGVTCIANIADRFSNPGWARVYEFIETDPILSKYYTALPVSSYHMTIHPMFTVSSVPGSTPRRFDAQLVPSKPAFIKFHEELVNHPFEPKGKIMDTYAQGIIVIAVELDPEDQKRTFGLRQLIHKLTGLDPIERYGQHITLAYRKSKVDVQDFRPLTKSLQQLIAILNNEVLSKSGGKLLFDKAQVMLFHDMALFQPSDPNTWSDEPLGDLPPTPEALKKKVKPEGWRAPWL